MSAADRELLELAAKATGSKLPSEGRKDGSFLVMRNDDGDYIWNPLTDDGDALRLAVKLSLKITPGCAESYSNGNDVCEISSLEECNADIMAATRRAIVCAAAEIGKAMP